MGSKKKKQMRDISLSAAQQSLATLGAARAKVGELQPTPEMEEVHKYWTNVFRGITGEGKTYSQFLPGLTQAAAKEAEARKLSFQRGILPAVTASTSPVLLGYLSSKLAGESERELGLREAEATSSLLQRAAGGIGEFGRFKAGLTGEQAGLLSGIASGYTGLTGTAAQATQYMGQGLFSKILGAGLSIAARIASGGVAG
jgi:hypothetical protein